MDQKLKKNTLNQYKFGVINFLEASKKLKQAGISEKNLKSLLHNIKRENIFFISDFLKKKHLSSNNKIKIDNYEEHDDEYYFEIEFEE